MSEMVERVARELAVAADHNNWEEFVVDARMAIAVMREPTEAMAKAGDAIDNGCVPGVMCWQAMIDEALK